MATYLLFSKMSRFDEIATDERMRRLRGLLGVGINRLEADLVAPHLPERKHLEGTPRVRGPLSVERLLTWITKANFDSV